MADLPRTPMSTLRALTNQEASELRDKYAEGGTTIAKLAQAYKINPGTVHKIIRRETYKDVP